MEEFLFNFTTCTAITAPFWAALVFTAYAIGRRQFSLKAMFALMAVEAILLFFAVGSLGALFYKYSSI